MRLRRSPAVRNPLPPLFPAEQSLTRPRYWDETREAGAFDVSDVLDPVTGFGGNGVGEEGCIEDGPFAGYVNGLGPGYFITEHCITRFVNNNASSRAEQQYIDRCYEAESFVDAWPCMEGSPHSAGHGGVGGLVSAPPPLSPLPSLIPPRRSEFVEAWEIGEIGEKEGVS